MALRVSHAIVTLLFLGTALARAADCDSSYAKISRMLEDGLAKGRYTFADNVYTRTAAGRPKNVELEVIGANGMAVANLRADLRSETEAYVEYYSRKKELAGSRVANWLRKKLLEKYPAIRTFTGTLSDVNFEQLDQGLKAGELPEIALRRTVFYKSCAEMGFTQATVRVMANSAEVSCSK